MTKQDVANFIKSAKQSVSKHSPEILTGIGIAGMITTTVLAVKATPKALKLIEERKRELVSDPYSTEYQGKLPPVEVVKVTWKCYMPAVISGAVSVACLIGAQSVHVKRNAALAAAYKLSETALAEYRDKVIETIGERKEKTVREKIAESRLEKNPVDETMVVMTDRGTSLIFDPHSARYFRGDIDSIKRVVNELNEQMLNDPFGYISLNDFYDELDLERTDRGDDLGWRVDKGIIKIDIHAKIAKNGEPAIVLDYINPPFYGYNKFT